MLNNKLHAEYQFDNFEFMFGVANDMLLSFLFLCCKYYIYRCRFREEFLNFTALKNCILTKRKVEYWIASRKGKLSRHFKKWSFDIQIKWIFFVRPLLFVFWFIYWLYCFIMHFTYKCIHIHLCSLILVHVQSFPLTLLHFMILCNFFVILSS